MHFADVPRHVGWWPGDLDALLDAEPMHGIKIIDPDGHPHAFLGRFIGFRAESRPAAACAATALAILAEENLEMSRSDATECRGRTPVPCFFPTELFEPGEALADIGDIQYRRDVFYLHRELRSWCLTGNINAASLEVTI